VVEIEFNDVNVRDLMDDVSNWGVLMDVANAFPFTYNLNAALVAPLSIATFRLESMFIASPNPV
jgi:hypothetical protein